VCGFSFGRNLSKLNYPVEAAVNSVLPLCDHFIFAVGRSEDDTRQRVAGISPKIQIIDTIWPEVQTDGEVLAIEANKAMAAAQATGCTWGFYIQADEVIHADDYPAIRGAMTHWAQYTQVKALLFRYLHFALDYQSIDPWMYHKACRIVRLDNTCHIVGDGCGPGIKGYNGSINNGYLDKNHLRGHVRWARDPAAGWSAREAKIYHYGWVKTRQELETKLQMVESLWWGKFDKNEKEKLRANKYGPFIERYAFLKNYTGPHPKEMQQRIADHPAYSQKRNRWLSPRFYAEVLRHGFHG
jgi:hypothetical protein